MRKFLGKMDLQLLLLMFLFTAFGLLMVFSSSSITAVLRYQDSASIFFRKQLITYIAAYLFGIIVILKYPTKYYYVFAKILLYILLIVLVAILTYGTVINGSRSWFNVGIYSFQPTEIAKAIMIIFLGVEYNKINNTKLKDKYAPIIPLGYCLLIAGLIFAQGDLGGAMVIMIIAGIIFISIPINKNIKTKIYKVVGIGLLLCIPVLLFTGNKILSNMQSSRFNFLKPCSRYQEDTGYQVCNGYIAIHNGGLFGVGLGDSTQKYLYLPESHTDFIFPIICEELGVIAGIVVILAYMYLLYRILVIAKGASNLRNSIIAYGTFAFILTHVLVNLLGVLGLIPLTGVPLPFLSYGGSHAITVVFLLFMVQRVAIENKEAKIRKKVENA